MKHKYLTLFSIILMAATATAQNSFQLPNAGFEQWDGGYDSEPTHWNTFESSDGSYASLASSNHHYRRSGHRTGGNGNYYLTIYTKKIVGVKANGNMTTGRIHAGSMSASNESNYNYTQRSNSNHSCAFTATPDSMYVWVSFYAASSSSTAQIEAIIHGDNDFRAPNWIGDGSKYKGHAVAQTTRTTTSSSQMSWKQLKVPFVYDGNSEAAYILVNMTNNNIPGSGEKNDSLSIDDIEFVYSAWLTDITIDGNTVDGFNKACFSYGIVVDDISAVTADRIAAIPEVADATVETEIEYRGDTVALATIRVTAEDGTTTKTYTIKFATDAAQTVGIEDIDILNQSVAIFPNPSKDNITVDCKGLMELIDLQGRIVLSHQCNGVERIDISHLSKGLYIVSINGKKTEKLIIE
ncbi:MAG: T9SS type A sorting domain-containing protein [Bacteroidales bacterium]|nr:T9SS type A sorting domain-containing protein [Bacteroidales bacterium]